jgi:hypothetical protein
MKVKLLVSRAGDTFVQQAGQVIDVTAFEARRLVDREQAEAMDKFPAEFLEPNSALTDEEREQLAAMPRTSHNSDDSDDAEVPPTPKGKARRKPAAADPDADALK